MVAIIAALASSPFVAIFDGSFPGRVERPAGLSIPLTPGGCPVPGIMFATTSHTHMTQIKMPSYYDNVVEEFPLPPPCKGKAILIVDDVYLLRYNLERTIRSMLKVDGRAYLGQLVTKSIFPGPQSRCQQLYSLLPEANRCLERPRYVFPLCPLSWIQFTAHLGQTACGYLLGD